MSTCTARIYSGWGPDRGWRRCARRVSTDDDFCGYHRAGKQSNLVIRKLSPAVNRATAIRERDEARADVRRLWTAAQRFVDEHPCLDARGSRVGHCPAQTEVRAIFAELAAKYPEEAR